MDFAGWSDEAFHAYLAGFTDGEGYVQSDVSSGGVRVVLANCVRPVLDGMRDRLGYGVIRSQQFRPHWQERHLLIIANARDCEDFLTRVRPYLHIKAESADAVLARVALYREVHEERLARNRAILAAVAAGETGKSVAARFGVSAMTVSRLRKLGPDPAGDASRGFAGKVRGWRGHLPSPNSS